MKTSTLTMLISCSILVAGSASCATRGAGQAASVSQSGTLENPPARTQTPASSTLTATTESSSTPPSTLTPTVTATPTAATISFNSARSLQVIRDPQNWESVGDVFASALSPDGRLFAIGGCGRGEDGACSNETILRLIDVDSGQVLFELDPLSPVIERLVFSPDGSGLAIAGCDLALYLVDVADTNCDQPHAWIVDTEMGSLVTELKGYQSNITSIVWSPDGTRLFTGVEYFTRWGKGDNEIRVFDAVSGTEVVRIQPPITNCSRMRLDITPDGRFLVMDLTAACGNPSFTEWWDLQDPDKPRNVLHEVPTRDHAFNRDGTQVLIRNANDNTFKLFNLESGDLLGTYLRVAPEWGITRYEFLDPDRLLLQSPEGVLEIYDLTMRAVTRIIEPSYDFYGDYLLSRDRQLLLTFGAGDLGATVSNSFSFWDLANWEETVLPVYKLHGPDFCDTRLAFDTHQTRFVCISWGGSEITVWGFPVPEQDQARSALETYLKYLADGDYSHAAALLTLRDDPYLSLPVSDLDYLAEIVPEWSGGSVTDLLDLLCSDTSFPCMPVREVVYQSQISKDQFLFVVGFNDSQGDLAVWPPCAGVPAADYCRRHDGLFEFMVERQPGGSYMIVNGLPPAIELRFTFGN